MKKFDWHCDRISPSTLIDASYKNTQNVRRFFKKHCGDHFKFDRSFMQWMKENTGKSMANAVTEWKHRERLRAEE